MKSSRLAKQEVDEALALEHGLTVEEYPAEYERVRR